MLLSGVGKEPGLGAGALQICFPRRSLSIGVVYGHARSWGGVSPKLAGAQQGWNDPELKHPTCGFQQKGPQNGSLPSFIPYIWHQQVEHVSTTRFLAVSKPALNLSPTQVGGGFCKAFRGNEGVNLGTCFEGNRRA